MRPYFVVALLGIVAAAPAGAATYTVGPTGSHPNLNALFAAVNLEPGDVVEVSSNGGTYAGGIIMPAGDSGAPGNPVTLRGVGDPRPHLSGGFNTIEFRSSNHVVMERFEISGSVADNTFRCVYHHAHDIVLRNVLVRDCPRHGVLGGDQDTGSLTIEYSELRNAGSGGGNHLVYMATDEVAYPGAVFRLQYSYLHDSDFTDGAGIGGNLIKSRAERNEIYYNWLEGAFYHELELIGPDPGGAPEGWSDALVREDSDVVGNVIVHTSSFGSVLRFGGDGTSGGRGETFGRYRVVNNTILRRHPNNDTPTVFRLFEGIDSLELNNNVIWREGGSSVTLVRAAAGEVQWVSVPKVTGSNNWIDSGYAFNPANLTQSLIGTLTGTVPGFANLPSYELGPGIGSPLLDAGTTPASPAGYEIANPLYPPTREPPRQAPHPVDGATPRAVLGQIDIGAFEQPDPDCLFFDGFES
jgi:hypothetical protein